MISDENESLALCAFYLALKCELSYAACDARVVKNKNLPFSEKIHAALNCADSMKKLLQQVKDLLPLEFELLEQCVQLKEIAGKPARNSRSHGLAVAATYTYKWSRLNEILQEAYGINPKSNKSSKHVSDDMDNIPGWMSYLTTTLIEAISDIQRKKNQIFVKSYNSFMLTWYISVRCVTVN